MSKYLEYTRYANTGVTKAGAPVLGRFCIREKLALEALCAEIKMNGGTPMDTETLLYVIGGTLDYIREQYALKCVRYRLFGITFEVACYGPFETADAKFDPAVNTLEVAVRLGDEIRNCLVNEVPKLVTDATASSAKIFRAMDIASGAIGIVIGKRPFRTTGRNVHVLREGESLVMQDAKGRVYPIAYDKVESPQRVEGHLVETPAESGSCKLILTTYAGDESEGARPVIVERVVSFVKFDEPVNPNAPKITRVVSNIQEETLRPGCAVEIAGEHLAEATVKVSHVKDGESMEVELQPSLVTANEDKIGIATDWYEEAGLTSDVTRVTFTVVTPNGSVSHESPFEGE